MNEGAADRYPEITTKVAGIFKGGGARGIVYAGALRELRARGIWFESVAGSSAGAITATLVAIGTHPDGLAGAADEALAQVPTNWIRGLVPWLSRSCYRTDRLQAWLEDRLRCQLGPGSDPSAAVTFRDLHDAGMIDLNVVAMDLHHRQPIVFNQHSTPRCSVAAAVVASCAIPVAMPAGRVVLPIANGGHEVHRLVDGGAWANYPAFVYTDESFRGYHNLPALPAGVVTLGFVLDANVAPDVGSDDEAPVPRPAGPSRAEQVRSAKPNRSAFDRGSARRAGPTGAVLSWSGLRWTAGIVVPALACWFMFAWLFDHLFVFDEYAEDNVSRGLVYLGAGFVILIAATVVITAVLMQLRFAYEAVDVGFPALKAALSVGTGVPRWVGHHPDDRVVRLWSPKGITTTSFKTNPAVVTGAIADAEVTAAAQLDDIFPDATRASFEAVPRTTAPLTAPRRKRRFRRKARKSSRRSLYWRVNWFGVSAAYALAFIADHENIFPFLVAYPALVWLAWRMARTLIDRRRLNQGLVDDAPVRTTRRSIAGWLALGFFMVVGGTGMVSASADDLTVESGDGATFEMLGFAAIGITYTTAGLGTMAGALGRLVAVRRHRQYRAEIRHTLDASEAAALSRPSRRRARAEPRPPATNRYRPFRYSNRRQRDEVKKEPAH